MCCACVLECVCVCLCQGVEVNEQAMKVVNWMDFQNSSILFELSSGSLGVSTTFICLYINTYIHLYILCKSLISLYSAEQMFYYIKLQCA